MAREYWITNSRFKLIAIILVVMWCGIMVLFYLKADEVTKDPCSICAEKMGDEVVCSVMVLGGNVPASRIYYSNGSIYNDLPKVRSTLDISTINFSELGEPEED